MSKAPNGQSAPKILVVDDVKANLVALKRLLSRVNAEVIEAQSGNDALSLTLDHDFALILLDVHMPEMDGYEVAELLQSSEHTQDIPIIFVTAAYKDDFHRLKGYTVGAVDYIEKPINDTILLSKVGVFLELHNRKRALEEALGTLEERNRRLKNEIAERKRIADVLHRREQQFKDFATAASDWFWELDADGGFTYISHRIVDITGRPPDFFIGRKREDILYPEEGEGKSPREPLNEPGLWLRYKALLASRESFHNFRFSSRHVDGSVLQLSISGVPVYDESGTFLGYRGTGADISALVRLERRLVDAIESIPASFMLFDSDDRLVLCNACSAQMFPELSKFLVSGTSYEVLARRSIMAGHKLHDGETSALPMSDEERLQRSLAAHRSAEGHTLLQTSDDRWFQVVERPTAEGGVVGVRLEITALKQRERELAEVSERLEQSNAELQQFAYAASHDLQEPLRMITSYLQLLQRRFSGKLGSEADEFIAYAVDGGKRMQKMILDLLAYSRVETQGRSLEPTSSLAACRNALDNLRAAIEESDADIHLQEDLPEVMADQGQLERLFQNLIGNAIKYRHPERPPKITITADPNPEGWQFTVSDNGIGIESQHFERIFGVFQRLHTRDEYSGTGIGLAICKRIIERHGGRLWVESAADKGSRFLFTLHRPLQAAESA